MDGARVAWTIVAAHLLVASFGFFLNDEADQISAFYNLSRGSLLIEEAPPSAYQLADNISWQSRWDDNRPVASTPLNVLALAFLPLAKVAGAIAPFSMWFSGLAALALWRAAGRPAPWSQALGGPAFVALFVLWLVLGAGFRESGPDMDYYGATVALNLTSLVLGIVGAILAWHVLGKHAVGAWRPLLLAALVLGPWLFWARLAKYHLLAAVVLLAIMALLQRPRSGRNDLVVGVLAGFAYWVNFGVGIVAILGIATLAVARVVRAQGGRLGAVKRTLPFILGGLLGLAPAMAESTYLFGNPFINFYFADEDTVSGAGASGVAENGTADNIVWATVQAIPRIASHLMHWDGPVDFVLNLFSTFTLGSRLEGMAFGIFWISPLLALSMVGAFHLLRGPARPTEVAWALFVVGWQAILGTNAAVMHGAGFDARLWFHALPLLAVLAAFGVRSWPSPGKPSRILVGAGFLALALFVLLWFIAQIGYRFPSPNVTARLVMQGTFVIGASLAILVWAWSVLRSSGHWRGAAAVAVATALALPMVWLGLFAVAFHPGLPTSSGHTGAGTYVPLMEPVSQWVHDAIVPPTSVPLAWDANGTLVYHPDHGSCLVEPNPCPDIAMPDELRWRLENATKDQPE